ncbi:hypothetical protein [Mesorhizobium sp.]|uniref:hypothetical protein n=1 Tax=Mesorhizobium sp. TaxID=1871066 RepID=UPI00120074F6|nr:hypothetical protein [Mesorhizobium sp.]TIO24066.1 MAG: hypothetical protein E5X83_18990 [Mesorhizobium sp.]
MIKNVAVMLGAGDDVLRDCLIEMFSEEGCLSAYDGNLASELNEIIVVSTQDGQLAGGSFGIIQCRYGGICQENDRTRQYNPIRAS